MQIIINGQNITLNIIDANEQRSLSSPGLFQHLNVGYESLYIGGVPNSIKERITKQLLHIRNASSLKGCLTSLYVNSQLKNLQDIEYSHKMSPGCSYKDACQNNKCQNEGTCNAVFEINADFSCSCQKGFTGAQCEIPLKANNLQYRAVALSSNYNSNGQKSILKSDDQTDKQLSQLSDQEASNRTNCKGRMTRQVYTDPKTGCVSKRKFKILECQGKCSGPSPRLTLANKFTNRQSFFIGTNLKSNLQRSLDAVGEQCCVPGQFETRQAKLFCKDGSILIANMNLARKCVCARRDE